MEKMSIVVGYYHIKEHTAWVHDKGINVRAWAMSMLSGEIYHDDHHHLTSLCFLLQDLGHVIVGGSLVTRIYKEKECSIEGVGWRNALDSGLHSIGISHNSILKYETAIKADKILIIAQGKWEELAKTRDLLDTTLATEVSTHCI